MKHIVVGVWQAYIDHDVFIERNSEKKVITYMRYAYACTELAASSVVFEAGQTLIPDTTQYLTWLHTLGSVEKPRGIVFHDLESATSVFSTHILPAWTDEALVHVDPLVEDWKDIYLSALTKGIPSSSQALVNNYYNTLNHLDIATIVAHELTHHLQIFTDTPEEAMWFEEGFCFYAPRKQLLPASRLAQLQHVEAVLIDVHHQLLGKYPVWRFGLSDAGEGFTDALFDYWRAIQTVSSLIDTYNNGDMKSLLMLFKQWKQESSRDVRLDQYLVNTLNISEVDQYTLWFLVPDS